MTTIRVAGVRVACPGHPVAYGRALDRCLPSAWSAAWSPVPNDLETWLTLVRAVWRADPIPDPGPQPLAAALRLARRNEVEGPFVRAYAARLPGALARLDGAVAAYRSNLATACRLLESAGVEPVLIKASPLDDVTYSNFDLVVGDDGWGPAVAALTPWVVRTSRYRLERATKMLLYPPAGPAVHLHRAIAWFDVPAVTTDAVRARATRSEGSPCLLPHPVDAVRIQLAHAVFQNQSLSLGELRSIRDLLRPEVLGPARALAGREGWTRGFDDAARTSLRAVDRLDDLDPFRLPAPLSPLGELLAGLEHAAHLGRSGRPAIALRELALRLPLVAAKQRRLRLA